MNSVQSTWTAGGMNANQNQYSQQQSSGRGSYRSSQQQQQLPPQIPSQGIHVPEDYEKQESQVALQQQKEKFFESLGLPPNLQENTIKTYQPASQQLLPQSSNSGELPLDDSSLFKSCNNAPSSSNNNNPTGPLYTGVPSHQKTHPHQTSYKSMPNMHGVFGTQNQPVVSDSSFLTAFDAGQSISQATPGDKRMVEQQNILGRVGSVASNGAQQYPQVRQYHNDSVKDMIAPQASKNALEEIKKYEELLVDSQRKLSAPVNQNHQRLSNPKYNDTQATDTSVGQGPYRQQQPMTFNNSLANHPANQSFYPERREILTITVDIGSADGETANILIREGDDPTVLAEEFAVRHGIMNEQLKELLAEQIKLNVEAVMQEEEELQRAQYQQANMEFKGDLNQAPGFNGIGGQSMDQRKGQDQQYLGMLNKQSTGTLGNGPTLSDSSSRGPHGSNQFMQLHQVPLDRQSYASSNQNQHSYGGIPPVASIQNTADALFYRNFQNQQTPDAEHSHLSNNSYVRQSMQQRQNSYGRMAIMGVNSSFVSDGHNQTNNPFGTMHNSQIFQYPGTQTYQQWKDTVSAQLKSQRANQPIINDNSKKIIQYKRQLNNTAQNVVNNGNNTQSTRKTNSGSVHQRLHQQAVSKQRQNINYNIPPPPPPNRINFVASSTRNQTKQAFNMPEVSMTSSPVRQQQRSSSAQGETHQNNTNSTSLHPPRDLVNYGERLYQKGIKRKEEQLRMLKEVRTLKEREDFAKECRFRPEINQISRMIAHPLRTEGIKPEEALIKYGQQQREKLEQKRSEQLFQELSGFNFKPQLAARQTTEKILQTKYYSAGGYESDGHNRVKTGWRANSADKNANMSAVGGTNAFGYRSNSADKFSDLYQDAMRRRERQDKIYSACIGSECTFHPDTTGSKYYYQRLESRDPGYLAHKQQQEGSRYQQPTQSRGRHFRNLSEGISEKERLQRSLKKSATFSNDLCDPDSGMPLFRPRVGRGPRNQQRPDPSKEKGATAIMLYNQSKALKEKMEFRKRFIEQEKESNMKKVHTTDKSNYIIEELKISHFSYLFRRLDSDADGQISCQKIDLSLVEPELLGVLEQIFTEMEELGQALTEEEWVDACCRLYEALPMPQKRLLFNPKEQRRGGQQSKQGKNSQQYAHRPKLDANSIRIAQQKRTGEDVAEMLIRKKKEYELRIQEKKQEKENMELVGCTFHPNIIQSPLSAGSNSASKAIYSRMTEGQRPSVGQTMPGSRSSFSTNSISGIQQQPYGNVQRPPASAASVSINYHSAGQPTNIQAHNQSFHGGNTSQHTATFHGGVGRDTNNTQNSNPLTNGVFDLNNLAFNVANEYLRPNNGLQLAGGIGGTFDQHTSGAPLLPTKNFAYRPPSVNANEYANRLRDQRQ